MPGGGGDGARSERVIVQLARASSASLPSSSPPSVAPKAVARAVTATSVVEHTPLHVAAAPAESSAAPPPSTRIGKIAEAAAAGSGGSYYFRPAEVEQGARPQEDITEPGFPAGTEALAGYVVVEIYVNEFGAVDAARMLVSEPEGVFDDAILEAVRATRFVPAVKNGFAVKTIATFETRIEPLVKVITPPRVIVPGDLSQLTTLLPTSP